MPATHLTTFQMDVTVPLGHGLCGGWIKPAMRVETPLWCRGLILLGAEAPVILAAVDWTGICNDAHAIFTQALARAAHTTPERVALHAVHQHNAPFVDITAQKLVAEHSDLPASCDLTWFERIRDQTAAAIQNAMKQTSPVTHIASSSARVEKVASNRRILGPDGKIAGWRGSSCKDPKLREAPEGLIDPFLQSLTFLHNDTRLATLQWYATHPMSYYGDGNVNADFVGLARERRIHGSGRPHLYFTGCAGNIAAGKYNDGAPERRTELAERIYLAMVAADQQNQPIPLRSWKWRTLPVHLPPRGTISEAELRARLGDAKQTAAVRIRSAMQLSFNQSAQQKIPIHLQALHLGDDHTILHLPAECFVEFQLFAQKAGAGKFIATAAYGNGGPWYIPTAEAYPQGGYEPSAAFVNPDAEKILRDGITKLLRTF